VFDCILLIIYNSIQHNGDVSPKWGIALRSFNLNVGWGWWSDLRPGRFTPGEDSIPIVQYRRLFGPQSPSGRL